MILTRNQTSILKAIAIAVVILGHIQGHFFNVSEYKRNILGTGGVCLFLILSGYGLYMSWHKNSINVEFWNKKINKILVPYWGTTIVYVVLFSRDISKTILLKNMFCVDYSRTIDGTMWYMSLLFIWWGIFFCVFYFKAFQEIKIILLFLFAFFLKENAAIFKSCEWQFIQNAFSFPIGVALGYVSLKTENISKKQSLAANIFISSICFLIYINMYLTGNFQVLGIISSLFLISIISCLNKDIEFCLKRVICWGGILSNVFDRG